MTKIMVFCEMPSGRVSPVFGRYYPADALTATTAEDYWDEFGPDAVVQVIDLPEPLAEMAAILLVDYIALLVRDPQALSLWARPF